MAGNIKGITIEFSGDTRKLDKSIKAIDKNTRSLDKELRGINKSLKFNPTSVELWKQKQQVLTEKISDSEEKLKLLKDEQARLDANNVDKNSKEYRELERQIIETESKLKTFRKQLMQTGNAKLTALGQQFKIMGDKMKQAGKSLTQNVTVPLMALGGVSIAAFKEVDSGLDIIIKKTGATGEALEKYKDVFKDIFGSVPTDAETAGNAIGEVATRLHLSGEELKDVSTAFIEFAKLNETDVSDSVDRAQKALAAYGLETKDTIPLLDRLNKTSQETGAGVDSMLEGLVQNAAAFQELDLSIDQSIQLMGMLETSGANSETVMQGLRKALKNAAAEGVPLNEALANLQDTIMGDKDGVDGLTASYDLFGKSGDQIYNAVKNGSINFKELAGAASDASGSVSDTFNATLDPADKFQVALNNAKLAGYDVGTVLLDTLVPAIQDLSTFIQDLKDKWESLSPGMQETIIKVAEFMAIAGPILMILGSLAGAIGSIVTLIGIIGPAIGALLPAIGGILVAAGPVVLIIGALIAAAILLVKNWDKIKAAAKALAANIAATWKSIKAAVGAAVSGLVAKAVGAFNSLKAKVTSIFNAVKTAITTPINTAVNLVKTAINKIKQIINGAKLKLPKIKLPHFKISGKLSLNPPSIPKVSVSWYKQGGIFDSASLIGVGEAGPEAVVPLDTLWKKLDAIAEASQGPAIEIVVNAAPGMDVAELAAEVERRLIDATNRRRMAW